MGKTKKVTGEDKEKIKKEKHSKRDKWERKNLGGFECIYPPPPVRNYLKTGF